MPSTTCQYMAKTASTGYSTWRIKNLSFFLLG